MKKTTNIIAIALAMLAATAASAQCNDLTLPYSEDFDSYTTTGAATKPDCWTRTPGFQPSSSNTAHYPNLTTASGHGTVLNFMGQGSSADGTGTMRIATPRIPAPLNSLEISFDVYKSGLTVYLATDYANPSTYTLVGSYSPGWSWTTYEVRTDTLTGASSSQGYLVFCGNYGSSGYSTAYIDNLAINALNPCQRTEFVRVDGITPYTATLSWPGVSGRQGYRVSYNTVNDLQSATSVDVPSNTHPLSGLAPSTTYYVWVQTICGATSVSDPRTTTFTTQDACYPIVDLHQVGSTSNGAAFQWEYDGRGNSATAVWVVLHDLTDSTAYDFEDFSTGSNHHFFSNLDPTHEYEATFRTLCDYDSADAVSVRLAFHNCGETELSPNYRNYSKDFPYNFAYKYSYSQTVYPASALYDMDTVRGIAVRRDTNGLASNSTEFTRQISVWMANTQATASTSSVSTGSMAHVAHGNHTFKAQEWDTLYFSTPFIYDGHSNVQLVICDSTGTSVSLSAAPSWINHDAEWSTYYAFNDNSGAYNPASLTSTRNLAKLADMRFVGTCQANYTCEAPMIAVTSTDTTFVEIEWDGGAGTQWVVEYRTQGAATWTVADSTNIVSYTLTGLQPSSYYEVRVGVVCDNETRYSTPVLFITACAYFHLPFHFTQNDMVAAYTNGFTDCWNHSQYFYRHRLTDSHRGCVYNAGNDEWFMLPAIAEPLAGARLRTWVGSSDQGWFKVGIASQANCSDVVWIDTIEVPAGNPNTSHDEYICYLDSYTGNGNRVVVSPIVNNNYHFMYFFDFHVEPAEGCRPPVRLALDSATATTLHLSWSPVGSATTWAVYVNGNRMGTTATPSYTATGLNPYTIYTVDVHSICEDSESENFATGSFQTDCEGTSCRFTIDARSATGDGWNGGRLNIVAGTQEYNFTMRRGHAESQNYLVCDGTQVVFNWLSGNADSVCSFLVLGPSGDTVFSTINAQGLGAAFFTTDSICRIHTGGNDDPDPRDPHQGIDSTDPLADLTLAPNPATSSITLSGIGSAASVTVVDAGGRHVLNADAGGSLTIDVSRFAKGVYFVCVVGERSYAVRKFIVR